jgi:hypothetical protein
VRLERRSIVRDDFARTRRGYDPDEVRSHLKQLAELVEELEQARLMGPVAETAASQVRSIVMAAERSGAELASAAEEQAERIRAEGEQARQEALEEAEQVLTRARAEAAERVEQAHEASERILQRAQAIENALAALSDETAALTAVAGREPSAEEQEELAAGGHEEDGDVPDEELEPVAGGPAADLEDIRLIALNMALNGSSREETAAYLRENFEIDDPEPLLDGVYAQARA